jgi:hypothetical protein
LVQQIRQQFSIIAIQVVPLSAASHYVQTVADNTSMFVRQVTRNGFEQIRGNASLPNSTMHRTGSRSVSVGVHLLDLIISRVHGTGADRFVGRLAAQSKGRFGE